MKHLRLGVGLACCGSWLLLVGMAQGKEESARLLEKLQSRGYGEVMVDYLDYLKKHNQLPEDVAENWDLYQSQAWRIAIKEAFNPKEVDERTAKSKDFLDKFVKAHPESPAFAEEMAEWADISFQRALKILGQAKLSKDKEKQTELYTQAREGLNDARPRFQQAIDFLTKKLEELRVTAAAGSEKPKRGKRPAAPNAAQQALERTELLWLDAKFKLAKCNFFLADTYTPDETEAGKKTRTEILQACATEFYDIYQRYREGVGGLLAHIWEGKSREELGDLPLAQEIYEEVLVLMPDDTKQEIDTPQRNMFAQVKYFSVLISFKQGANKELLDDTARWLKTFDKWKQADGYQGVAYEYAKYQIAEMNKLPADQRAKVRKDIDALLKEGKKIRGEHHAEIVELGKQLQGGGGGGPMEEPKTWEEAVAQGDDLAGGQKWDDAQKAYEKAVTLAGKVTENKRKKILGEIADKLDGCAYNQAYILYAAGKDEDAIAAAMPLVEKFDAKHELAPKVGSLWVRASLRHYAQTQEKEAKEAALTDLSAAAKNVIDKWPDKAEADDARIALGQSSLVQGKPEEALEVFEAVNPRSERYPMAQQVAAQTHLRLSEMEKQKPKADPKEIAKHLAAAQEELERSVAGQAKAVPAGQPAPQTLVDAQLMLAQVYSIAGESQKVADLLQPILDGIKASKPQKLDPTMLKMFTLAAKAYVATGDATKSGDVATVLTDLGDDTLEVNTVLVKFAEMLDSEYRGANAALIEARSENDLAGREAAEKRLAGTGELLNMLVGRLAARQNQSPKALIIIGRMAAEIGQIDKAAELFNRIVTQSESDEEFNKQVTKELLISVRSQLIEILGKKKQFAEGVKQADALIEQVPKALEPQLTKGRLLQDWAEQDATKFPEAANHWASLRNKLDPLARKGSTPADIKATYYEVNLAVAVCLLKEADAAKDSAKAIDAQKVLNAMLIPYPKLNGPEMVAKYKEQYKKCEEFLKKNPRPAPTVPAKTAKK